MARFAGTDKNEFINNQRVEGNLFELLNEAMGFCRKHLNMSGKIVGLVREEHLDIPAEALREALLNALCHRWYEHYNMTIGLAIYDDRIEIENPGMVPPQMDMEHIEQAHYSSPHNPRMANVLYQTGYIENWGSGIQRIIATCQKYDVALPTWQQMPGNVVVVTFARNTAQTGQNIQEDVIDVNGTKNGTKGGTKDTAIQLTERQHVIVNLLEDDGTITIPDLARKIRLSVRTVKRELETLQTLGVLHREGGRKEGRWVVDMKV
ncbi:MAG: HTH domain-containing protein [Bacteroidales bacterium]|nr:HTH domain-containing protein [Bacteroidales bacterium]